jgi:hypothetical protein
MPSVRIAKHIARALCLTYALPLRLTAQPTLDDTMQFIVRSLSTEKSTMQIKADSTTLASTVGRTAAYFNVSYSGCTLNYETFWSYGQRFVYQLDISNLPAQEPSVIESDIESVPKVYKRQSSDQPILITVQDYSFTPRASMPIRHMWYTYDAKSNEKKDFKENTTLQVGFQISDRRFAQRMAKAFGYVINLCSVRGLSQ